MTAVRVTKSHKHQILVALLDRAFRDRREALTKRRLELGNAVYHRLYRDDELKSLKNIPTEFLNMSNSVRVQFASDYTCVYWEGMRPISSERSGTQRFNARDPLTDLAREIEAEQKQLDSDEKTAKLEARAKLDPATTLNRLLETWPEIEPLARRFVKEPKKDQLPVPANEVLNAKFKLPISRSESKAGAKASVRVAPRKKVR